MTTDLKDVLINLDSKIAEVYDLDLVEEMTDIYIDLTDRLDEFSSQYWKLVKALAKTERDRDDLVRKLRVKSEECKTVFEIGVDTVQEERKIQDELDIEKDQAEYDRDYYRNEAEWFRNEAEWYRKEAEKERRLRVVAEYEKELAEMELLEHS